MQPASDPAAIDAYITACPEEVRAILQKIRAVVLAAAPEAEERISYRMPALFQNGVLVYYAAFKDHIGLYPPVQDETLRARLATYAGPKGNLRFPLSEPIPYPLIARVVKARLKLNRAKQERAPQRSGKS